MTFVVNMHSINKNWLDLVYQPIIPWPANGMNCLFFLKSLLDPHNLIEYRTHLYVLNILALRRMCWTCLPYIFIFPNGTSRGNADCHLNTHLLLHTRNKNLLLKGDSLPCHWEPVCPVVIGKETIVSPIHMHIQSRVGLSCQSLCFTQFKTWTHISMNYPKGQKPSLGNRYLRCILSF